MNLASLGLAVDSRPVATAAQDLDRFTGSAGKAQGATDRLRDANGRYVKGAAAAAAANDNAARAAGRLVSSYKALIPFALRLGGVLGALGGVALSVDVRGARELSASLAEVSTLIEGTDAEMQRIQTSAREMGREFGTTAASQVKAFYQAISAGATDLGQATLLLESANKVAIGGITDTVTAVDVLTTATNAYATAGLTASNASDALFVGMRAGKTTISELASSLGQVIPIAASLGVDFDQLVAGVAALTTQGQSTAQAVTGVRAILSQVAKPADEAAKLAKKLGLEFNTASLQAKGLSGFLDDVIAKTGGNVDAMAKLFGSVEALNAALSFAGGGGDAFTKIMQDMANKAGAADAAYQKVADSLDKRLGNALNRIADVAVRFGEALLTVIVPAAEAFATVLELIADNAADLAIVLAPIAAVHLVRMIAGFAGLAAGMNVAAVAARALSIAMAFVGGPIGLALTGLAAAFLLLRDNMSQADKVARDLDLAYATNQKAMDAAKASSDGYTTALRNQIAMQVEVAKTAYAAADASFYSALKMRDAFRAMTGLRLAPLEYMTDLRGEEADRLGALVAALQAQLAEVDKNLVTPPSTPPGTPPGLGGLGGSATEKKDPYAEIVRGAQQFIEAQRLEAQALGMTEQAANRLRYEQDLLNKAANDNIKLTPAQTRELKGLAVQMADTEAATKRQADVMSFAKDATKGFFSDLRSGLQQGKSLWESFGTAALNVLNKIIDKLQNELVDAMFAGFGGGGGQQGGLIGALLQGFGGGSAPAFDIGAFYAKGGVFGPAGEITAFAKGGVVDRATVFPFAKGIGLMGEAGPEAIMPLRRGPDGSLGVRAQAAPAANSNGGGTTVIVNNYSGEKTEQRRSTDGDGREIIEVVVGEVRDNMASGGFDKVMGGRFGSRPARVRR